MHFAYPIMFLISMQYNTSNKEYDMSSNSELSFYSAGTGPFPVSMRAHLVSGRRIRSLNSKVNKADLIIYVMKGPLPLQISVLDSQV